MKKITLQWRITLLTALVLTLCTAALTGFAIFNAQATYAPLLIQTIPIEPAGPEPTEPTETTPAMPVVPATLQEAKRSFDLRSIAFCLLIVAGGTAAVYAATGRALRSVRRLSEQVNQVDEHNLAVLLPQPAAQDEVGRLTQGFNHMLARLNDAFLRQKRFTANAAHELKTPLATIKAGLQVAEMDPNATLEDYRETARITQASVDRLSSVVNDLLLLAAADEQSDLRAEEVSLGVMLESIQSELEPLYENKGIVWALNGPQLTLMGNAAWLYRAFYNLMENACKYSPEGGRVQVEWARQGQSARIALHNQSAAIDPQQLALLFEPFYRVDDSRSRKTAGSGLGLSLVKAIVERHGGAVTAHNEPNEGVVFTVELPE